MCEDWNNKLKGNSIGGEGSKKLCEALMTNTSLTEVNLKRNLGVMHKEGSDEMYVWTENNVGDEGAKYFAELLTTNKTLTSLNLSCDIATQQQTYNKQI